MLARSKTLSLLCAFAVLGTTSLAQAGEWDTLPERKATTMKLYMHPQEAMASVSGPEGNKVLFVDVRTPQEAMFVGMPPVVDANIPYMVMPEVPEWDAKKKAFKLVPNSGFLATMQERLAAKGLTKDDMVILICRSGDRSASAANLLAKAGFSRVFSVVEGFEGDLNKEGRRAVNGWKNDGLPWSFELDKNKMTSL